MALRPAFLSFRWQAGFLALVLALVSGPGLQGQFGPGDMAANLEEARTYRLYPTYEQYLDLMQGFAADFPEICRLDTLGTSVEGRLLLALKISDQVEQDEAEPAFLYSSSMHGDEILGYVLLLRLADSILHAYGSDAWISELVDSLEIWINPLANPDGAYAGGNHSLEDAVRGNAQGLDLNRYFPNILEEETDDVAGRPLENQHMMHFLREHGFHLSANIHSGQEVINYPWDWKAGLHPDDAWFRFVSLEYADEAREIDPRYLGYTESGIINGYEWYEVQGSRQDYVTYYLGGREVTLELSREYLLEAEFLQEYWEKNRRSLLYYMTQATYGIHGQVSDLQDGTPLRARIEVLEHDDSTSMVFSDSTHGDFYRYLKGGSYDLRITAEGYEPGLFPGVQVEDYASTRLNIRLPSLDMHSPVITILPNLRIYPNPAGELIHLETGLPGGTALHIRIISPEGRICRELYCSTTSTPLPIQLDGLGSGLYLLQLRTAKHYKSEAFLKF